MRLGKKIQVIVLQGERPAKLGLERALVVHGQDGMDELTTTTASWAASLENGKVTEIEIAPEGIGVRRATLDELKGGDAAHNAEAIHALLDGEKNAFRDLVLLNSAAAIMVAGKARDVIGEELGLIVCAIVVLAALATPWIHHQVEHLLNLSL